jgi:hypothetical protein
MEGQDFREDDFRKRSLKKRRPQSRRMSTLVRFSYLLQT